MCECEYLFEIVEAVDNRCLCRGQLWKNVKQLQDNVLVVVDDGQMERPVCRWWDGEDIILT